MNHAHRRHSWDKWAMVLPALSGRLSAPHGSDQLLLGQLVSLAALLGGTLEYCEIIRRRAQVRLLEAERLAAEEAGLRGMVRVFLAEG
jgi:hypothetical protein